MTHITDFYSNAGNVFELDFAMVILCRGFSLASYFRFLARQESKNKLEMHLFSGMLFPENTSELVVLIAAVFSYDTVAQKMKVRDQNGVASFPWIGPFVSQSSTLKTCWL